MAIINFDIEQVVFIHDAILETEAGLNGYYGDERLGGALGRIDNAILYGGVTDTYDIAARYIQAIAKGHCFADCNKRTGLIVGLDYLRLNAVTIARYKFLAHAVALLAADVLDSDFMAEILFVCATQSNDMATMREMANYLIAKMDEHGLDYDREDALASLEELSE